MKPWRQFEPEAHGNPATGYLLVGEAPGYRSWKNRRRFTGPAGMLVRRALQRVGHPRYRDLEDLFYMTDAVKCHPASPRNPEANRAPRRREIAACAAFLVEELRTLHPRTIVTFGRTAADAVARALSEAGPPGRDRPMPEVLSFPHPSPRNQVTILTHYTSVQALEVAIAGTFRRLIARLDATERSSCACPGVSPAGGARHGSR